MPRARTKIAKGPFTGIPDGGAHLHKLVRDFEAGIVSTTSIDGRHTHLFLLPTGEIISTKAGGAHVHSGETTPGYEELYGGQHDHVLMVGGVEFRTNGSGEHEHCTQVESTALDGVHDHWIQLGDDYIWSLTPQQLALIVGLGVGEMDDILISLRSSVQPAVKVEHGNATELRTPEWTVTKAGSDVCITRGWRQDSEAKPVWAGYVHVTYSADDRVEFWLTDKGHRRADRVELCKSEDKWTYSEGGKPIALSDLALARIQEGALPQGGLPLVVRRALPLEPALKEASPAEYLSALHWLVKTNWWDRYQKGEVKTGTLADYVKEVLPSRVQSPMGNEGKIEKNAGLVFLHECEDQELVSKALREDHLILATAGTDHAGMLLRTAEQLGHTVSYSKDERAAGLVVATSLDLDLVPCVTHAYDAEQEKIYRALKAHLDKTDLEETPEDRVWAEDAKRLLDLGKSFWGPDELGLAARLLVQKPFAGYADFDTCVKDQKGNGHSEDTARKICGSLQADLEKSTADFTPLWNSLTARDLPLADRPYNASEAKKRILAWSAYDQEAGRPDQARKGFLVYDEASTQVERGYEFPITDVVDGALVVVKDALEQAERQLASWNAAPEVKTSAQEVIDAYKARFAEMESGLPPKESYDPANFPENFKKDEVGEILASLNKAAEVEAILEALEKADTLEVQKMDIRSIEVKKTDGVEERFVYGVVMEPLETDAHGDTQTAETIRETAHKYMETYKNIGLQHQMYINESVKILQTFIAPVDFKLESGEFVKKGSWVMGVRVLEDKLWNAVKSGKITGFSIGGRGIRAPIALD